MLPIWYSRTAYPPQARGWTRSLPVIMEIVVVSPAGAGMDPSLLGSVKGLRRIPRRRRDGLPIPLISTTLV